MSEFSTKVVLITGASSGIGAATAKAFAKHGACLSITGRTNDNLGKVARECRDLGAKEVLEITADLEDGESVEMIMNETTAKFQKLDILVNNAGNFFVSTINDVKADDFDKTFSVNVKAPLFLTQSALPHLEKTGGNVVNISSLASVAYDMTGCFIYGMAKSAVDYFTKKSALEVAVKGIRINAVNPGSVRTNILRQLNFSDEDYESFAKENAKDHPLGGRFVEATEIVDAILFLASDAAKMITGTCMLVDGGRALKGH